MEKLLEIAGEDEKAKLETLNEAVDTLMQEYKAEKTKKRLDDWESAEAALHRTINDLGKKYFHKGPAFKNRKAVVTYLKKEGYDIGRQKVYDDVKNGKLKMQDDKSVLYTDVEIYSIRHLSHKKTGEKSGVIHEKHAEKTEEEIRQIRARAEKIEFETKILKKKFMKIDDHENAVAELAATLDAVPRRIMRLRSTDYVYLVGGDPAKAKLIDDLFNADLDEEVNKIIKDNKLKISVANLQ